MPENGIMHLPRKLRVMLVDDEHVQPLNTPLWERQRKATFWAQAGRVCRPLGGRGEPCPKSNLRDESAEPCESCPFSLDFYSWFPPAICDIVNGKVWDVLLVDWNPNNDPGNKNSLDDEEWQQHSEYSSALPVIAEVLKRTKGSVGGREVIEAALHFIRNPRPFIVMKSTHGLELERDFWRQHVNVTAYQEDREIAEHLREAYFYFQTVFGPALPAPVTDSWWEEVRRAEPIACIDFTAKPACARFDEGFRFPYGGTVSDLTEEVCLNFSGGKRLSSGGLGRAAAMRHLMRMGQHGVAGNAEYWVRAFGVNLGQLRTSLPQHAMLISFLQEGCTHKVGNRTIWAPPVPIVTSVDEAEKSLYHGMIGLGLIAGGQSPDHPASVRFSEAVLKTSCRLAGDVSCYRYDATRTPGITKSLIDRAIFLGNDNCFTPNAYCDLEMLFIPRLMSLCLEKIMSPDLQVAETCAGILHELDIYLEAPTEFVVLWGLSEPILLLRRDLRSASQGGDERFWDILEHLFAIYSSGRPLYPEIIG